MKLAGLMDALTEAFVKREVPPGLGLVAAA